LILPSLGLIIYKTTPICRICIVWIRYRLYFLASSCLRKSRGGLDGTRSWAWKWHKTGESFISSPFCFSPRPENILGQELVRSWPLIPQLWLLLPQPTVLTFVLLGLIEDT
jgi:hypothetical protein